MRQGLKNSVRPALLRLQEVLAAEEGNAVEQWLVSASVRTRRLEGCLVPLVDPMDCSSPPTLMTRARVVQSAERQRWLGYLVVLIAEFLLCFLCLLSFSSHQGYLLFITMTSCSLFLLLSWLSLAFNLTLTVALGDFCRTPEQYMLYLTRHHCSASQELLDYFLFCPPTTANPFQKDLVLCHHLLSYTQNAMIHPATYQADCPQGRAMQVNIHYGQEIWLVLSNMKPSGHYRLFSSPSFFCCDVNRWRFSAYRSSSTPRRGSCTISPHSCLAEASAR
uniref:Protein tweety homolog n=1 Tax=Eptatretus burgeri TaxID=7764 RepID=A0A8C4Q521_EPTBU